MSILKIARMGHPVLGRPAEPVADPSAPDVARLVDDMLATLDDIGGLGLAAPQVHVALRVVIFHLPAARLARDAGDDAGDDTDDDDQPVEMTVLVNPVIEPIGEAIELGWESCLSVPGLRGLVPRARRIRYAGLDLAGRPIDRQAAGLHARVVQHECDHLDGVLYPQRMTDLRWLIFESEMKHALGRPDLPEADR